MLAQDFNESRTLKDSLRESRRMWVQPKLDGIRARVTKDGVFSRNDKKLVTVPHIEEALKSFFQAYPNDELDGELYCHDLQDNFPKLCSIVKKLYPTSSDLEEAQKMQYWIFDSPTISGSFGKRTTDLWFAFDDALHPLIWTPTDEVTSNSDVYDACDEFVKQGFEGAIVRLDTPYEGKRSAGLLKLKPTFDEWMIPLKVEEGMGKLKGHAGAIIVLTPWGKRVRITAGGDYQQRQATWQDRAYIELHRPKIHVKYQKMLPSGDLRHAVQLMD